MKYGFKTFKMKVENHEFWVAESTELKGCAAQGDTLDEAITLFEEMEEEWLETAVKYGIPIPKQRITENVEYSGVISLRLGKTLHRKIAEAANEDGVSINKFITCALSECIGYHKADNKIIVVNAYEKNECHDECTKNWSKEIEKGQYKKYTKMGEFCYGY